jgi:RecA-family ATPase
MPKAKPEQPVIISTKKASRYGTSEPRFLWFPFLPYRKLIVLQGESGIGKSSFILNIAALLSKGKPMPFTSNDQTVEHGDILYFNKEDDIEETINPRLIAMGADLDRFHFADETFFLDNDCRRLEATINELNIRLVIIDPLTSFLGRSHNMNTAQSVGNLMRGLSRVAFTTGSAIVVVCHLTKNAFGKEIDRHLGSSDIINAARSVISATRENDDSDVVTVKHLKSTLAKRAKPFYYEIVGNGVMEFTSGETAAENTMEISVSKKELAIEMITNLLSDGAKQSTEIIDIVKNAGIGESTINAAKREAFIESKKIGDNWLWQLPYQDVNRGLR